MYEQPETPLRELARNEPLLERARLMTESPGPTAPNGIRMVRVVSVDSPSNTAVLDVHFYNLNYLPMIVARYTANNRLAKTIFPVTGGTRLRAGSALGQVQVDSSPSPGTPAISTPDLTTPIVQLIVAPIGDYSTYTLGIAASAVPGTLFDPLFSEIRFKFRPGCFNNNCAPDWETSPAPFEEPVIDYLAKDYGSFRQTIIAAMTQRVPEWEPTSEADLDMVLAEIFSVAGDELSDYQDRVMNEAYLGSTRKRVSLARHARLMDYHIHQGNQASSWLALEIEHHDSVAKSFALKPDPATNRSLMCWAGKSDVTAGDVKIPTESSAVFLMRDEAQVHQYLNNIGLYTWSGAITTLRAGSTRADLKLYNDLYLGQNLPATAVTVETEVRKVYDLIRQRKIKYLVIQEHLNPRTGLLPGRDPAKRQLLELLPDGVELLEDTVASEWFVRVRWKKEDALRRDYCFTVDCPADSSGTAIGAVENVSLFHGNLVEVFHGRQETTIFLDEDKQLTFADPDTLQFHYERTHFGEPARWGVICRLPEVALAYKQTQPGGDSAPFSTLSVTVQTPGGGKDVWDEVPDFIHSDDSSENGDHFVVETDENRRSLIRFGNGINGRELPDDAIVSCTYQHGLPLEGNVGADRIINVDKSTVPNVLVKVRSCWNPFDVTNGIDREPVAEIIRRVPEAYRQRQLRAITLADYVDQAKEIEGVSAAAASYAWTGSWRTVRVTIDPVGTTDLSYELRNKVADYLNAVRLIGEDLEIRAPIFVPLEIRVTLCATSDVWAEDIRFVLEQEFSAGWTPSGRKGFFHPDLWTFGQPLYASQIIGRALQVKGVEHTVGQKQFSSGGPGKTMSVSIRRKNSSAPATESLTQLNHNEIIQVASDPDHLEQGFITFDVKGGRQ